MKNGLPTTFSRKVKDGHPIILVALSGVIPNENLFKFQRTLFRIGRGNILTTFHQVQKIDNKFYTDQNLHKTIVLLTIQDSEEHFIQNQVKKVCEHFQVQLYNIPKNWDELNSEEVKAGADNYEANNVLETTFLEIQSSLKDLLALTDNEVPLIYFYKISLLYQYNYYSIMNKLELGQNFYQGRFWLPTKKLRSFFENIKLLEEENFFAGVKIT